MNLDLVSSVREVSMLSVLVNKISQKSFKHLESKNLLAFSGGIDSTCLYFFLLKMDINFDIAIVNYNRRAESKEEVKYAQELSIKHNKKCFLLDINLGKSDFESRAREARYEFFYSTMIKQNYQNLVLAQHLNDKLEWFLMQLTRGAGLNTLLGFNEIDIKIIKNKSINILRPLIFCKKSELEDFNNFYNLKYFIDKSNFDQKYRRNYFRHNFSNKLLDNFSNGVANSFRFLHIEKDSLYKRRIYCKDRNLIYFQGHNFEINDIDCILKENGYLLGGGQKDEIKDSLENKKEIIIAKRFIISKSKNNLVYIGFNSNLIDAVVVPKRYRDKLRQDLIPAKIRKIIYFNETSY